jgi:hypothetical protein
MDLPNPDV